MENHLEVQGVEARLIVQEIRAAIADAALDAPAGQGGLELHSVDISMVTVAEIAIDVKPKFKVPVVGWEVGAEYSYSSVDTHHVDVSLVTPWGVAVAEDEDLKQGIADARTILPSVASSLRELLETAQEGEVPLTMKKAKATFKFEISDEGKLSLAVPSAGRKWGSTISMTFTFGTGRA